MKQYEFNTFQNEEHSGIITILDYEISFLKTLKNQKLLKEIEERLQPSVCKDTRLIFDLALLSGVNEYRFVEIRWIKDHFLIKSKKYVTPNDKVTKVANQILVKYPESLKNSMLSDKAIKRVIDNIRLI